MPPYHHIRAFGDKPRSIKPLGVWHMAATKIAYGNHARGLGSLEAKGFATLKNLVSGEQEE